MNGYDDVSSFGLGLFVGIILTCLMILLFYNPTPRIPSHSGDEEVSIERLNRNLAPEYRARLIIEKVEEKK